MLPLDLKLLRQQKNQRALCSFFIDFIRKRHITDTCFQSRAKNDGVGPKVANRDNRNRIQVLQSTNKPVAVNVQ